MTEVHQHHGIYQEQGRGEHRYAAPNSIAVEMEHGNKAARSTLNAPPRVKLTHR